MKIVTWNLRCQWTADGINGFIHRAGMLYDKVLAEKPDVIAFQEVIDRSLELTGRMLPEYEFIGSMRSADYTGEGLYIAVRKDSCAVVASDVFWLSPTPYVPGSRFDKQSMCPRVCVAVKLRNLQTGEVFRVVNVHLDHVSDEARILGVKCLLGYVQEQNAHDPLPTVILGDFNALPESETIRTMNEQRGLFEATKKICGTTFHNFGRRENCKIDYIYITDEWKEKTYNAELWTDEHEGIYLSDHYPVCVTIE